MFLKLFVTCSLKVSCFHGLVFLSKKKNITNFLFMRFFEICIENVSSVSETIFL